MGISGLLPFLKGASRNTHVSEFKGQTIGIDVYVWLHKGAFGCAEKLVMGQKTNGYILYVMKYVDLLLYNGIKPVLVFDGRNLPSKSETEKKRRENRTKYKKMAKDYLAAGQYKEARDCFTRCIDITPEMARETIAACRERNIDCIVAPYEADAQLAYLRKSGIVDMIISEDSDLTLFGCDKILFKLDLNGNGVLVEMSKLNVCLGSKADNFSFEKFRYMCIMSGCDYLASLHGIGLGKACKFWGKVTNLELRSVLPKIPSYLNMHQLNVTSEYIDGFIQADQTFMYQLVFDPRSRKLRPLNDYQDETLSSKKLPFCGEMVNHDLALGLALGNIDLHTLIKVSDFNPDEPPAIIDKPKYGKRTNHDTIWKLTFTPENAVPTNPEEIKRENDKLKLLECYGAPREARGTTNTVEKKRKREPSPSLVCTPPEHLDPKSIQNILDTNDEINENNGASARKRNPFAKKTPEKKAKIEFTTPEHLDLESIQNILDANDEVNEDEKVEIIYKSRFFKKNDSPKKKTKTETESSKRISGDWLEALEDSSPSAELKYTPGRVPTVVEFQAKTLAQNRNL